MKKVLALLGFLIFSLAGISQAEPLPRHSVTIGPEVYYYVYEEDSIAVHKEGVFFGFNGSAVNHFNNNLMLQGELRAAFAKVDYQSEGSGSLDDTNDSVWEGRILAGYDFVSTEDKIYTVYSGLGYRLLNDNGSGAVTSFGHIGYDRISNYYYLPLGLQGAIDYGNGWRAQTQIEFDYLIGGRQRSKLGSIPGYSNISNDQEDGLGFRLSMRFQKLGQRFNFFVEPFFHYWKIDDSQPDVVTVNNVRVSFYEPQNTTTELGVNCQLDF